MNRALLTSGNESERVAMDGTYDAEVGLVESGDPGHVQSLGDGHEACVGTAQGQVGVGVDELADALPVTGPECLDKQVSADDRRIERRLGTGAELALEEIRSFGYDHGGRHERPGIVADDRRTTSVVTIGTVGGSDEHTGVDDQHWSVAPEALGEDLVHVFRDAVLGCTDTDEGRIAAWAAALDR